jgi:1-acyl-sn-glycerol-3-phosphate acyltransferase
MYHLRATAVLSLIVLNTLVHATPLLAFALLKALVPLRSWRRALTPVVIGLAEGWIATNSAMVDHLTRTRMRVREEIPTDAPLRLDGHYLVLANHQSWVDIVVLQKLFNRRVPFQRFFLKRQLFWVPVLGLCWWALDFPFMGRYTRQQIARRPELGERDMATVRRACAKFRDIPVSVMNFVEGTRFTEAKHARQASPFRHLLKPRSGGVAFAIEAMGGNLRTVLDVTIVYPGGRPTMMTLMGGRISEVLIEVRQREVPEHLLHGDYSNDNQQRVRFQAWLNAMWEEKDARIARMLAEAAR